MPPQTPHPAPPLSGSGRRPAIIVVATTILVDFVGFGVLVPVLPEMAHRFGADALGISLLLAAYAGAQLVFLPAWGWCSDRFGRRPVVLVSLAGTVASFVLLALADGLALVYVSRILGGFFAASVGTAQAVITDITPPSERASGMGKIGAAAGVGMVLGPALGGLLDDVGPGWPFYAVSAIAAVNFVGALFFLPETRPAGLARPDWRELAPTFVPTPLRVIGQAHDRPIGIFLYLWLHLYLGFAVVEASLPIYLLQRFEMPPFDIGLLFAALGVVVVFTQGWLVGRVTTRRNEGALMIAGCMVMAVGLGLVPLMGNQAGLYAVGMLIALGNGFTFPIFTSIYSRACAAGEAGELLGEANAMGITGRVLGAIGAGILMDEVELGAPFWAAAMVLGTGTVLLLALRGVLAPSDEARD